MAPPADSARFVADTLVIEPLGVRFTIPSIWMGRVPAKPSVASLISNERGRFACELLSHAPLEERVILDKPRLAGIGSGLKGFMKSYQDALDAIVPVTALVAHAGGVAFRDNCLAPQAHIYVVDTAIVRVPEFASRAMAVIEREYSDIKHTETDSAGWHVVRLGWREAKTDFIHPVSLEFWSRRFGGRLLVLGVMTREWVARGDTYDFVASMR